MLSATSVQVNLTDLPPALSLPDISDDVEQYNDRHGQIGLEETLCRTNRSINIGYGGIKLRDKNDNNDSQSKPGSPNAKDVLKWNFVKSVPMPDENSGTFTIDTDVTESSNGDDGDNSGKRSSRLINKGEELRSVALLRQSHQGSATTVNTRNTDGQDGNKDDDVHEGVVSLQSSVRRGDNERRGARVVVSGVEESLIG
ncbi:hypothetical protein HG531_001437 [Fusarium graminearum]|nr:hypothetical protein HG531_001437 [Fusarium graminearum]